jgi:hypothetical protein
MTSESPETIIGRFLDYLGDTCGSDQAQRRLGASWTDIEQFRQLVGLPLPASYAGYLHEFGSADNYLQMADDGNPKLPALIRFYIEDAGEAGWDVPAGGIVISLPGLTGSRSLYYPEEPPTGEPFVAVNWGIELHYIAASTFEKYLYRQALIRSFSSRPVPSSARRDGAELIPELADLVRRQGFEVTWFSDDYQLCCARGDQSILALQQRNSTVAYFYGRNREEGERLRDQFSGALSLRNTTPHR